MTPARAQLWTRKQAAGSCCEQCREAAGPGCSTAQWGKHTWALTGIYMLLFSQIEENNSAVVVAGQSRWMVTEHAGVQFRQGIVDMRLRAASAEAPHWSRVLRVSQAWPLTTFV